ncbi:MAG: hypothetical protein AUI36_27030, partial [Cyanobacteria bacterium 13_1_40CM_2_61_4]
AAPAGDAVKILFLAPRFPYPPHRGDRLTTYHLIRTLSARHQVTLLSFTDGTEPKEARREVSAWCHSLHTVHLPRARSWAQAWLAVFSTTPSQVAYFASPEMQRLLERTLAAEPHDLVFAQTVRLAPIAARVSHPNKVLFIGDSHGMALARAMPFYPWWRRIGMMWEQWRIERFGAGMSQHYRETWALSPVDFEDLARHGCRNLRLVPHGVDERLFDVERKPQDPPRVVFLGNLGVPHNVDAARFAAEEVWPRIRRRWPQARLVIAGADPAPSVARLASLPGVEVPGRVSDLREMWSTASVMLAPLRFSTGIQNKVLEAIAAGVPVVTTEPVARGIGARAGEMLLVGADADELASAVCATLDDPAAAASRIRSAREHVSRTFSWAAVRHRLEELAESAGPLSSVARMGPG